MLNCAFLTHVQKGFDPIQKHFEPGFRPNSMPYTAYLLQFGLFFAEFCFLTHVIKSFDPVQSTLDLNLDRIVGRGISLCPIAYLLHFGTMPKISFVRSFTSFNENSTANTQLAYDFLLHRRKLMMSIYHELRALYNFHSTSRVFPLQTIAGFKPTIRLCLGKSEG